MSSILKDMKKVIGIEDDESVFDQDLIMHINTAFMELNMLGVGQKGFIVTDDVATWDQFLNGSTNLEAAKSYTYCTVRLVFDRPETSYGISALEKMRDRWAWLLEINRSEDVNG